MSGPAPSDVRRAIPAGVRPLVADVVRAAEAQGVAIGLVGGPVRDWLLGREIRDVDLVAIPPDEGRKPGAAEVARAARASGDRVVHHRAFGTVRIERAGASLDLATVRSEVYGAAGALPIVGPGTLRRDLERRDFTVNALLVPLGRLARRRWPGIVDAGQGRSDLEARVLRVFHPRSFHDDPTRALRAARLASRLRFRLARSSRTALRDAVRDGAFGAVSGERYRAELSKLFVETAHGGDPVGALRWLSDAHVLAALEPGLQLPPEAAASLRRWLRPRPSGHDPAGDDALLTGLMLWFAPFPPALRRRALRRFVVTGSHAERIGAFPNLKRRWVRELTKARGRGSIDAALGRIEAPELAALGATVTAPLRRKIDRWQREDRDVVLPVGGEELLAIGLRGPAVGHALARVRAAVLDRVVHSRDDALALAREIGRPRRARRGNRSRRGKRAPR